MGSASALFSTFSGSGSYGGYLDGTTNPPLIQNGSSCLNCYGGDMPRGQNLPAAAATELNAWAAAGAQNN